MRTGACVALGISAAALAAIAQPGRDQPETPRQPVPAEAVPAIQHDDASEIRAAIADLYSVISGPAGERDWDAFRAMFADGAQMTAIGHGGGGSGAIVSMTPQQYIERAGPQLSRSAFYERQIASRTEIFGHVAHVWSTYESLRDLDGQPFSRGINSVQLVRVPPSDAGAWKVLSILWDSETPQHAIPAEYLED